MNWTWILQNSGWLLPIAAPIGLVALNVIVKLTPWHGDDDLVKIVIASYREVMGKKAPHDPPK